MLKKILLIIFFSQSFIQADQALSQLPVSANFGLHLGVHNESVIQAAQKARWTVKTVNAKKYGSKAFFAAALGLYVYRIFSKNIPENCVLVQISPPINQGLIDWTTKKVVAGFGKIIEGIATQSLISLFFSVLPQYNITCDTQWFFTKQTQIKVLTDNLAEAFAQLPLLEDKQAIEYHVAMITHKMQLLTKDLIRLFGFLRYSQEQKEGITTFNAVCMLRVIENIEQVSVNTFQSLENQLFEFQKLQFDVQQRTEKAASLNALFIKYVQSLFADVKTFIIYEKN